MDIRGCGLRLIVLPLLVLAATLLLWRGAAAQAQVIKSWPAPDGLVASGLAGINVVFAEPLDPKSSGLTVSRAADSVRVDRGDSRLDSPDGRMLAVSLPPDLPSGKYRVNWTAVSAKDGSKTTGDYAFTVTPFLKAEPPPGSDTKGSPLQVTVTFAEILKPAGNALTVTDDVRARVDLGDARLDPADPSGRTLRVSLPADLRAGKYFVAWTAALADGRVVSDTYGFTHFPWSPEPARMAAGASPLPQPSTLPGAGTPSLIWSLGLAGGALALAGPRLRRRRW